MTPWHKIDNLKGKRYFDQNLFFYMMIYQAKGNKHGRNIRRALGPPTAQNRHYSLAPSYAFAKFVR